MALEHLNQKKAQPTDLSDALRSDALESSNASFLRGADKALGDVVGGKYSEGNYIVREKNGRLSYIDFGLAPDIYESQFSPAAKERADKALDLA